MKIYHIRDENDENVVRSELSALRKQRTQPRISIQGLPLPDTDMERLEAQIQQMITAELDKYEQTQLQELNLGGQPQANTNRINVSLAGLQLPDTDTKRLETQIQQMITAELAQHQQTSPQMITSETSCVCAFNGVPGDPLDVSLIVSLVTGPPPPLGFFNFIITDSDGDVVLLTVFPGVTSSGTCSVGLANRCRSCWNKQIEAWNLCQQSLFTIEVSCTAGMLPFNVNKGCFQTDTLIFRKPKFFGAWTDMFHIVETEFWSAFGGTRALFTWVAD
jgi:hypothetical protein